MADDCAPDGDRWGRVAVARCGPAHTALLSTLHGLCFDHGWNVDAMGELLAMPGALAFIATVTAADASDDPVGFILARTAGPEAEIITIGVRPEARGHGVGQALFAALCRHGRDHGVDELFLEVAQDNAPARRFYARAGCKQVGRRPNYYSREGGPRVDALVLRAQIVSDS